MYERCKSCWNPLKCITKDIYRFRGSLIKPTENIELNLQSNFILSSSHVKSYSKPLKI